MTSKLSALQCNGYSLACSSLAGRTPRVIFCGGFNSNRHGNKALALEHLCRSMGQAFTRFDYSGHGDSGGDFADGNISTWLADTLAVIDSNPDEGVLLVGSSMGGWLSLLAALDRKNQVRGLVLLACAADMTRFYSTKLQELNSQTDSKGRAFFAVDNQYDDQQPYCIYQNLLDDGEQHVLLNQSIKLSVPVRLIHGMQDDVVAPDRSLAVASSLQSNDVITTLIKGADHRLSDEGSLEKIEQSVRELLDLISVKNISRASPS